MPQKHAISLTIDHEGLYNAIKGEAALTCQSKQKVILRALCERYGVEPPPTPKMRRIINLNRRNGKTWGWRKIPLTEDAKIRRLRKRWTPKRKHLRKKTR